MPKIDRTGIATIKHWLTTHRGPTTILALTTEEEAQALGIKGAYEALASFANATSKERRLPAELLAAYEALDVLEAALIDGFRETSEEVS